MQHTNPNYSFKIFGSRKDKIIFLFTALGTKYWLYFPVINFLKNTGYVVIVYDVNPSMALSGNFETFLQTGEQIVESVKTHISDFKKQEITKFYSFGVSMGTLFAIRSAIDIPEIKKVVINLTYGRLADNVWSWSALRKAKRNIENRGISREQLDTIIAPISPVQMAKKLKGKKVLLYLAKRDKILLFSQSIQFKNALDDAKVDYIYHQNNWFGHFITGAINNLKSKIYLDFLNEDMDYPIYQASDETEKTYKKAVKEHTAGKTIKVKDLDTFFEEK